LETVDVVPLIVSDKLASVPSFDFGLGLLESTWDEELRIWGAKIPCTLLKQRCCRFYTNNNKCNIRIFILAIMPRNK